MRGLGLCGSPVSWPSVGFTNRGRCRRTGNLKERRGSVLGVSWLAIVLLPSSSSSYFSFPAPFSTHRTSQPAHPQRGQMASVTAKRPGWALIRTARFYYLLLLPSVPPALLLPALPLCLIPSSLFALLSSNTYVTNSPLYCCPLINMGLTTWVHLHVWFFFPIKIHTGL